ncbi:hypothetical protein BC828DRAFT_405519 [Blastocladiella britannica]|nr:hypothetical protein BC828DRAFT_405519 [Blastocladiella britannica]
MLSLAQFLIYMPGLCFSGSSRTGNCYAQVTESGIKDCPPSVPTLYIALGAGAALIVVLAVIGIVVHFRRRLDKAASTAAAPASLLSSTVTDEMGGATPGAHRDQAAKEAWRRTSMLPSMENGPTPVAANRTESTVGSLILPAGLRHQGVATSSITNSTASEQPTLVTRQGEADLDPNDLALPGGSRLMGSQVYAREREGAGASRPLL